MIEVSKRVVCPWCGKTDSTVDHLGDNNWVQWSCNSCYHCYSITIENSIFTVKQVNKKNVPYAVVLTRGNLGLVHKAFDVEQDIDAPDSSDEIFNNFKYYFEMYTCPANILRGEDFFFNIETLDDDEHGIFEVACVVPWPESREERIKLMHGIQNKEARQ